MMPHRAELWESQARIAEAGPEVWMKEMEIHFACPSCGKVNTSYDIKCPSCGNIPGNHFAGKHSALIKEYFSKLSKP
jgi:rubrerythrin